jgi:hypothetical protein
MSRPARPNEKIPFPAIIRPSGAVARSLLVEYAQREGQLMAGEARPWLQRGEPLLFNLVMV